MQQQAEAQAAHDLDNRLLRLRQELMQTDSSDSDFSDDDAALRARRGGAGGGGGTPGGGPGSALTTRPRWDSQQACEPAMAHSSRMSILSAGSFSSMGNSVVSEDSARVGSSGGGGGVLPGMPLDLTRARAALEGRIGLNGSGSSSDDLRANESQDRRHSYTVEPSPRGEEERQRIHRISQNPHELKDHIARLRGELEALKVERGGSTPTAGSCAAIPVTTDCHHLETPGVLPEQLLASRAHASRVPSGQDPTAASASLLPSQSAVGVQPKLQSTTDHSLGSSGGNMYTRWHAHEQKHSVGGVGMGLSAPPNLLVLPAPQPMSTEAAAQGHGPSPGSPRGSARAHELPQHQTGTSEAGEPSSRARALKGVTPQEDANVQLSSSNLAAQLLSPMSLDPDLSRRPSSKSIASALGEREGVMMDEGERRGEEGGVHRDDLKASADEGGAVEGAGITAAASPVVLSSDQVGEAGCITDSLPFTLPADGYQGAAGKQGARAFHYLCRDGI